MQSGISVAHLVELGMDRSGDDNELLVFAGTEQAMRAGRGGVEDPYVL